MNTTEKRELLKFVSNEIKNKREGLKRPVYNKDISRSSMTDEEKALVDQYEEANKIVKDSLKKLERLSIFRTSGYGNSGWSAREKHRNVKPRIDEYNESLRKLEELGRQARISILVEGEDESVKKFIENFTKTLSEIG